MFNWFKRKPKAPTVPDAPYTITERSEQKYREERIKEVSGIWEQPLDYTAMRLDQWVIHEIEATRWPNGVNEDSVVLPEYVATPLWDDEWMLAREAFPTYEQAVASVNRVGGVLLHREG